MLGGNGQACNRVNQAKDEMSSCKVANIDHGLSQAGFDNAIAHADNKEEEKGKRVAPGI